jgi:hypothetical protein
LDRPGGSRGLGPRRNDRGNDRGNAGGQRGSFNGNSGNRTFRRPGAPRPASAPTGGNRGRAPQR